MRPDGERVAWTLAFPKHVEYGTFDGVLPFFIEWESPGLHPGGATPKGLNLRALWIGHPKPAVVRGALLALGLDCEVGPAPAASITVELETPRGRVTL